MSNLTFVLVHRFRFAAITQYANGHYRAILRGHDGVQLAYDAASRPLTRAIQMTDYIIPPVSIIYIRLP